MTASTNPRGWAQARNFDGLRHFFIRGNTRCESICAGRFGLRGGAPLADEPRGRACAECRQAAERRAPEFARADARRAEAAARRAAMAGPVSSARAEIGYGAAPGTGDGEDFSKGWRSRVSKTCAGCGETFWPRDGEPPGSWRLRRCCEAKCARKIISEALEGSKPLRLA